MEAIREFSKNDQELHKKPTTSHDKDYAISELDSFASNPRNENKMEANQEARIREIAMAMVNTISTSHER